MMHEAKRNGYKTVPQLTDALGYKSTEKLYRLGRNPDNKPSFQIIEDLTNLFDNVDLRYLITGEKSVYEHKETPKTEVVNEPNETYEKLQKINELFKDKELHSKFDDLLMYMQNMSQSFDKMKQLETMMERFAILQEIDKEIADAKKSS